MFNTHTQRQRQRQRHRHRHTHTHKHVCVCVCVCLSHSLCISLSLSLYLFVCMSVCLPVWLRCRHPITMGCWKPLTRLHPPSRPLSPPPSLLTPTHTTGAVVAVKALREGAISAPIPDTATPHIDSPIDVPVFSAGPASPALADAPAAPAETGGKRKKGKAGSKGKGRATDPAKEARHAEATMRALVRCPPSPLNPPPESCTQRLGPAPSGCVMSLCRQWPGCGRWRRGLLPAASACSTLTSHPSVLRLL